MPADFTAGYLLDFRQVLAGVPARFAAGTCHVTNMIIYYFNAHV